MTINPTVSMFYVKAKQVRHRFQWVDAKDAPTEDEAIAYALAHPDEWSDNSLEGPGWEFTVNQHDVSERAIPRIAALRERKS